MVCRVEEVPAGALKEVEVESGLKVLVANAGGDFYACQAICPHQEVPLCEGLFDGEVLTCHMHLWQWDIRTGAPQGLAESPLQLFDITVEDGAIYLAPPSALDSSELFKGLPRDTLARLQALCKSETHPEGSTLYRVGDPAEDLYILESGRVEFLIGRDERTTPAGFVLRTGEVFGWAALMDGQPSRIARATCLEKSSVLRMNGREVLKVLESDPASGYLVMRRLAELITRYLTASGAK
jgi:toluene monooxygenase system ferredoxin subunit